MITDIDKQCIDELQKRTGLNKKDILMFYKKSNKNAKKALKMIQEANVAGTVYGNISTASITYGMDKFQTPRGHGFAAERANHITDKLSGKKVGLIGDTNEKNGADRIVNGVSIQSKYCRTGSKCISECFENGKFKYRNSDGSLMKIEVPFDLYEDAVQAMKNRISKGEVQGVTDISEAENIVCKGHYTYEQAKNIAKFGRIDSLVFDMKNGSIIAKQAIGVSASISFAVSIWNGEDLDIALKTAALSGLQAGGTAFAVTVLSSQICRTRVNHLLVGSSEAITNMLGSKASAALANAFRSGTNIYGAAALKSTAKLLRGNIITSTVSIAVLSSMDIVRMFRGRISTKQLFKNLTVTTSSIAGGTGGWIAGASTGAVIGSAFPIIGTAVGATVGGIVGSFAGGTIASESTNAVMNLLIEDDAEAMVKIIETTFVEIVQNYLLNEKEIEIVLEELQKKLTGNVLQDMYASNEREEFASNLLLDDVETVVKSRKKIQPIKNTDLLLGLKYVLEELY